MAKKYLSGIFFRKWLPLSVRVRRLLIAGFLLCALGVLFVHYTSLSSYENESRQIISEVSRIYMVPTGETPTVARLQDKSKIDSNEAFYKNAQDGDYLILYSQNGLALLYREQVNKLVNVAPITDSGVSTTQPSSKQ